MSLQQFKRSSEVKKAEKQNKKRKKGQQIIYIFADRGSSSSDKCSWQTQTNCLQPLSSRDKIANNLPLPLEFVFNIFPKNGLTGTENRLRNCKSNFTRFTDNQKLRFRLMNIFKERYFLQLGMDNVQSKMFRLHSPKANSYSAEICIQVYLLCKECEGQLTNIVIQVATSVFYYP